MGSSLSHAAGQRAELSSYAPALRRYFRKRAAAAEIDDLTQEVFLNMQARRAPTRIENLEGYLFAVAANVLSRQRTRRHVEGISRLESSELYPPQVQSAEDEVAGSERIQRLVARLEQLPPRARKVFFLNRFEGMTYGAIARTLHISESAIEKHIMSALKTLRAEWETER